jgi:hypothetical protein
LTQSVLLCVYSGQDTAPQGCLSQLCLKVATTTCSTAATATSSRSPMNILLHAWHAQQRRMDESVVSARALRATQWWAGKAQHSTQDSFEPVQSMWVRPHNQLHRHTRRDGHLKQAHAHTRTQSHTHHHTAHLNSTGSCGLTEGHASRSCGERACVLQFNFLGNIRIPGSKRGVRFQLLSSPVSRMASPCWRRRLL